MSNSQVADVIGWTLFTLGFGAIVLLVFYEIGLSEDRDRASSAPDVVDRLDDEP